MSALETLVLHLPRLRSILQCPSLSVLAKTEWGSRSNADNRLQVRRSLYEELQQPDLLDLSRIPESSEFSISVSHCTELGGFAICERPMQIGFDVEIASRVQDKVVARVSSPEELLNAPSAAHLWTAKEAAYKSLRGSAQPSVLASVAITNWRQTNLESANPGQTAFIWEYRASIKNVHDIGTSGRGALIAISPYLFAFFTIPAQLRSGTAEKY